MTNEKIGIKSATYYKKGLVKSLNALQYLMGSFSMHDIKKVCEKLDLNFKEVDKGFESFKSLISDIETKNRINLI